MGIYFLLTAARSGSFFFAAAFAVAIRGNE
jgi:hypothetical protein